MRLPNAKNAIVEVEKLRNYCLNQEHPRGKHKALVFQTALGMTDADAEELLSVIKERILMAECEMGEGDDYGQRYVVDLEIERKDKNAVVRTAWIIKRYETCPRLTTCYVK